MQTKTTVSISEQTDSATSQEAQQGSGSAPSEQQAWKLIYLVAIIVSCVHVCLFMYRNVHMTVDGGQRHHMPWR